MASKAQPTAKKVEASFSPFSRADVKNKVCPVPMSNWSLGTLLVLGALGVLVDAVIWAPTRCTCESVIVDGSLPFSRCSAFLSTFQCYHEAPCTGTAWPTASISNPARNIGLGQPCKWCPKVGDKIPYYATISAAQCATLPTTGSLSANAGKITVNFDTAACSGGKYPHCKAAADYYYDMGPSDSYRYAPTPNKKCNGVAKSGSYCPHSWNFENIDGKGWVRCAGFHRKEVCSCPTLSLTLGAASGYVVFLSTVCTAIYVFLANHFDPQPVEDGAERGGDIGAVEITMSQDSAPEIAGEHAPAIAPVAPGVEDAGLMEQLSTMVKEQFSTMVKEQISTMVKEQVSTMVKEQVSTMVKEQVSTMVKEQVLAELDAMPELASC